MEIRDVLIVGAGIAGCASALALVNRGISVTMITSPFDERAYHHPFIQLDSIDDGIEASLRGLQNDDCSSLAFEQFGSNAKLSIDELIRPHCLVDRNGNIDIHHCLKKQLEQHPLVEWLVHDTLIELLTIGKHSKQQSDRFKKPACLGGLFYNQKTNKLERILAKETILATGGVISLYPFSTQPHWACGQGLAMASQAGVRLLNMGKIHFHPLGLYEKGRSALPLPTQLLDEGGVVYFEKGNSLERKFSEKDWLQGICEMFGTNDQPHLWVDLSSCDPIAIQEKYPTIDAYCRCHGFNFAVNPLPIVPVATSNSGGIVVDKNSQSSLQRLRAIGQVACTGLFYNYRDETSGVLESLTWAITCAEDVVKQISRFSYYLPDLQDQTDSLGNSQPLFEDWQVLRKVMWCYVGPYRSKESLERAKGIFRHLLQVNAIDGFSSCTIQKIQLFQAIQTAQLIVESALSEREFC